MKNFIALTALAATLATGATAMTNDAGRAEIKQYAGTYDATVLSDGQILSLLNVIHGGDTENEKRLFVRNVIQKNGG